MTNPNTENTINIGKLKYVKVSENTTIGSKREFLLFLLTSYYL
jgi:hypothetical protein